MTGYEKTLFERDIPQIRKSLQEISSTLKTIITIISDPGDEQDHVYSNPNQNLLDNYVANVDRLKDSIHDLSDMD